MLCQQFNLLILSCGHSLLESCPNSFLQCLVARVAAAWPIPAEAHVFGGGHKGLHYLFLRAPTVRIEHSPLCPPPESTRRIPAAQSRLFTYEHLHQESHALPKLQATSTGCSSSAKGSSKVVHLLFSHLYLRFYGKLTLEYNFGISKMIGDVSDWFSKA